MAGQRPYRGEMLWSSDRLLVVLCRAACTMIDAAVVAVLWVVLSGLG